MPLLRGLVFSWLTIYGAVVSQAQLSDSFVRQAGMENAWKSHVQVPLTGRGVVSTHLYADADNSRQYALVELPERTFRVAADTADRDGNPIGMERAKQLVQEQAGRFLGKPDGFEVVETTVPQIKLILVTSDGLVQTLDAETGQVLWSTACGNYSAPAYPAAVSEAGVVVLHGVELFVLDVKTGRILKIEKLRNAASSSVAICGDLAFVTDYSGHLDSYGLVNSLTNPYTYVMSGLTVGKPVSLAGSLFSAFATDRGYMYVFAGGDRPSEWIRYESASPITGCLAARGNAFYVGNAAGVLEKITLDDRKGSVSWVVRTAETLTAPPLVVGNDVFAVNETGSISAIEDDSGIFKWRDDRIGGEQPVSVAGDKLFCRSKTGSIMAVDKDTGRVIGNSRNLNLGCAIVNDLTDRVYVLSRTGQIQCFRPIGQDLPMLYENVPVSTEEDENASTVTAAAEQAETKPPATGDPFAPAAGGTTGGDPFADPFGTTPAAGGDPFGGGTPASDPFGTGSGTSTPPANDPFGGGSDPFNSGAGTGAGNASGNEDPFGTSDF
jgi:outer membrane protein assembly factor BamB